MSEYMITGGGAYIAIPVSKIRPGDRLLWDFKEEPGVICQVVSVFFQEGWAAMSVEHTYPEHVARASLGLRSDNDEGQTYIEWVNFDRRTIHLTYIRRCKEIVYVHLRTGDRRKEEP